MKVNEIEKKIPWQRMSEIATVALSELFEAIDSDYAIDILRELDMTQEEREYFGIFIDEEEMEEW